MIDLYQAYRFPIIGPAGVEQKHGYVLAAGRLDFRNGWRLPPGTMAYPATCVDYPCERV